MVTREDILKYSFENYGTKPEKPWDNSPTSEVLRHNDNKKWYGIIMNIRGNKVGLGTEDFVDIINVKAEPEMISFLAHQKGFALAYHMNKTHWITIVLNGTIPNEQVYNLLDMSYELTKKK